MLVMHLSYDVFQEMCNLYNRIEYDGNNHENV